MKSPHFSRLKRFGVFEFDAETGELRKHGLRIKISRRTAQLLAFLLENPGRVRTREEIKQLLWPENTFVEFEHNLNKAVFALRAALCDSATNPRFIETLAGQGYRFIPVSQVTTLSARISRRIESLAVLPFLAENAQPELGCLGRQIALNLIDTLSKMSSLRVLAHSTVKFCWQRCTNPLMEGRNLGVRAIVAGEFIRKDRDLLLHVELVDVADGRQVWGTQARCTSSQGLKQSEEIAEEISQQLSPILVRAEAKGQPKLLEVPPARTTNLDLLAPAVGLSGTPKLLRRFTGS